MCRRAGRPSRCFAASGSIMPASIATGRSAPRSSTAQPSRKRPRVRLRCCCRGRIFNGERRHQPPQALVVTSLGNASYLWATLHEAAENFYFEDAMGLALPLALGLAIAQPERPVIVVEGDGGLLMHMGTLGTGGAG